MLLLVAVLPLAFFTRLVLHPGIRKRFRGFPSVHAVIAAVIVLSLATLIFAAIFSPPLLYIAALLSIAILGFEFMRRRASFGVERGLPPGSLTMFSTSAWRDPDYYGNAAKAHGCVFKFQHLNRPAAGIVGIRRIEEFLRLHSDALEVPPAPFTEIIPGGFVRYLRGTEHDRVASALRIAFNPGVVAHHDARLRDESRRAANLLQSGQQVSDILEGLSFRAMVILFFDLEPDDAEALKALFDKADYRRLSRTGKTKARAAVRAIIEQMRVIARDQTKVSFLSHLVKSDPATIQDDAILGNLAYALHTGRLDVAGALAWLVASVGRNHPFMQQLRNAITAVPGETQRVGGIADRTVRETLRLHQSEFILRRATREIVFEGHRIPVGWHVRLCIAESHRSAGSFANAQVFDPDRFLEPHSRSVYAPFGFAPHSCPGEHLTRAIGKHFVAALADQTDLKVTDVEPWEFTGFHWKPNSRMQVTLAHHQ